MFEIYHGRLFYVKARATFPERALLGRTLGICISTVMARSNYARQILQPDSAGHQIYRLIDIFGISRNYEYERENNMNHLYRLIDMFATCILNIIWLFFFYFLYQQSKYPIFAKYSGNPGRPGATSANSINQAA